MVTAHIELPVDIRCSGSAENGFREGWRIRAEANGRNCSMSWTDERVETLKRLWTDGLSASQIASTLGEVTRNAVIGKIHRLGLSGRVRPGVVAAQPAAARKPRTVVAQEARTVRPMVSAVGSAAVDLDREYVPAQAVEARAAAEVVTLPERVTIMMLNEQTCRWPIGDPGSEGFSFCGKRSQTGLPYCTTHARVAYQPPERRRERRGDA